MEAGLLGSYPVFSFRQSVKGQNNIVKHTLHSAKDMKMQLIVNALSVQLAQIMHHQNKQTAKKISRFGFAICVCLVLHCGRTRHED